MAQAQQRTRPGDSRERVRSFASELIADPVRFSRGVLRHRTWWKHERMLRAPLHSDRIAVKACHKSSKTFAAAELTIWWLSRFSEGRVVTTAPVFKQVRDLLWPEIRQMARASGIAYPEANQTELRLGPKNFAVGISTRKAVSFQGWSGRVLLIIDEAPGVEEAIFTGIESVRAGGRVTVLMLGNPTIVGGPFYDAFGKERHLWDGITINGFDTPNVAPLLAQAAPELDPYESEDEELVAALRSLPEEVLRQPPAIPDLISPSWILDRWDAWGPEHPKWEGRVAGRFPEHAEHSLIPLSRLERCKGGREAGDLEGQPVSLGIDPAGPGENETAGTARCGPAVLEIEAWHHSDPRGPVLRWVKSWAERRGVERVCVDATGLGRSLCDHLKDHGFGEQLEEINVGTEPWAATHSERKRVKEEYRNLKALLYWNLRQRAEEGGLCGLDDEMAIGQLSSIRWRVNPRGQIEIEKKDEMKSRGLDSPDRAEATMLAFAEPPSGKTKSAVVHY